MSWGKPPTAIPLIEDQPRLWRRTLLAAGALGPGQTTFWSWEATDGPSITITGGDAAFVIKTGETQTRVVVRKRTMVCPQCGCECFYLLYRAQWCCRRCSGCDHRIRHCYRSTPVLRRLAILRALAKVPALSLKAHALRFRLNRINREIAAHVRRSAARSYRRK